MAKKKTPSGKRAAAPRNVPVASPDDPEPTKTLPVARAEVVVFKGAASMAELADDDLHAVPGGAASMAELADDDLHDDPGPTKALPLARPEDAVPGGAASLAELADDEVHDDPGPTKAVPLARAEDAVPAGGASLAELADDEVHDDSGPTKTVPSAEVLDEIETEMALGHLSEAEVPRRTAKPTPGKKR